MESSEPFTKPSQQDWALETMNNPDWALGTMNNPDSQPSPISEDSGEIPTVYPFVGTRDRKDDSDVEFPKTSTSPSSPAVVHTTPTSCPGLESSKASLNAPVPALIEATDISGNESEIRSYYLSSRSLADAIKLTLRYPTNVYAIGSLLTACSHRPPPPTPVTRYGLRNNDDEETECSQLSPIDLCQKYPPLKGMMGRDVLQFKIQKSLQSGVGYHAQVFQITLCGPSSRKYKEWGLPNQWPLVAKLFDPLFFNDEGYVFNPFRKMDQSYTHEAEIYHKLADFQGSAIANYYGSYSLDLPLRHPNIDHKHRQVRMILLEYIQGITLSQLRPWQLQQSDRQSILSMIVDFESKVYQRNISLRDLDPRNTMLVKPNGQETQLKFIDFGDSFSQRYMDDAVPEGANQFADQYISPLLRWCRGPVRGFNEWVDWDWEPWLKEEFASTAKTITPEIAAFFESLKSDS